MPKQGWVVALLVGAIGCGSSQSSHIHGSAISTTSSRQDASATQTEYKPQANSDRFVILSAHLTLETPDVDTIQSRMLDLAQMCEGYVLTSKNGTTTIRIPAARFRDALAEIETWAEVLERNIQGNDVTEEYTDLEIRLANTIATRDRYLALLDNANTIEEMLKLERELERLSRDIDQLKGRLNQLSQRIDYATVAVTAIPPVEPEPERKLGPLAYIFDRAYRGLRWLVVRD